MSFRLLSERQADGKGQKRTPVGYKFPKGLRRRLMTTMSEAMGVHYVGRGLASYADPSDTNIVWETFDKWLYKGSDAYADFTERDRSKPDDRIRNFMQVCKDIEFADCLDIAVGLINLAMRDLIPRIDCTYNQVELRPDAALEEIDHWLRDWGSAYRVAGSRIIDSTDDFTHEEIILPALRGLREPGFTNAAAEFDDALRARRNGDFADAITKANHCFESTMKIIAGKMGWPYEKKATAKPMIAVMIDNGLVPKAREAALTGLRTLLESELPTMRNKTPRAGHGAGEATETEVPEYVAEFALQTVAANVNLLIAAYQARRK